MLFNNPALRCLSASTGTDFELVAQSRTEENVEEKYKAEQRRADQSGVKQKNIEEQSGGGQCIVDLVPTRHEEDEQRQENKGAWWLGITHVKQTPVNASFGSVWQKFNGL